MLTSIEPLPTTLENNNFVVGDGLSKSITKNATLKPTVVIPVATSPQAEVVVITASPTTELPKQIIPEPIVLQPVVTTTQAKQVIVYKPLVINDYELVNQTTTNSNAEDDAQAKTENNIISAKQVGASSDKLSNDTLQTAVNDTVTAIKKPSFALVVGFIVCLLTLVIIYKAVRSLLAKN